MAVKPVMLRSNNAEKLIAKNLSNSKQKEDQLVREKHCIDKRDDLHNDIKDHELGIEGGTFRRLGSHPQDNKELAEKFPEIDEAIRLEALTGGIELEPLLAIRRSKAKRFPLHSSDVTGVHEIRPNLTLGEEEYSQELEHQIEEREYHKQEEEEDCKLTARRHFDNWDTFWGRAGHGAPKPVKVRENLDYILYQLPILIRKGDVTARTSEESEGGAGGSNEGN